MLAPDQQQPDDSKQADSAVTAAELHGTRSQLVSHAIVLQMKLVLDGLRDAALIPLSLAAAAYGYLFNSKDPWVLYREVLLWGRASDHWIDLFDGHKHLPAPNVEDLARETRRRLEAEELRHRRRRTEADEPMTDSPAHKATGTDGKASDN